MNQSLDFQLIASTALSRANQLLVEWLPGGVREGHEYKALNPTRADKRRGSFSINLRNGSWADFATHDKGGDLISLYAYLHNLTQIDAAKALAEMLGIVHQGERVINPAPPPVAEKKPRSPWVPVMPAPDNFPPPPLAHYARGRPDVKYTYYAANGAVNGYIYRFTTSDGGKDTLPVCYCTNTETGAQDWRFMAFGEPRPLYNLHLLAQKPNAPVLLVEGEKCADAANLLLDNMVAVTWAGGCKAVNKADWAPLQGRHVIAWSDCDALRQKLSNEEKAQGIAPESKPYLPENEQPGMRAMLRIREILTTGDSGGSFQFVDIPAPGAKKNGWDIVDAIEDQEDIAQWINRIRNPPANTKKPKDQPVIDQAKFREVMARYVLIYGTDTCYDIQDRLIMKVSALRLAIPDYVNLWLKSSQRKIIRPDQLVFDPTLTCKETDFNLYDGFDIKPKPGNFNPILELLHHLCADSAPSDNGVYEVMQWVLKWLALPLQKPGAKMRSALVFHGPQGTGKNLFFEVVTAIYGRYALIVGQGELEEKYNDWMSQKLFLIGDEVIAKQELYDHKNKLKTFITGTTVHIHGKFLPLRSEKNHINVVFLSNEDQPLALEPADRRYFVVYTPPQRTDGLYQDVAECIKNGGIEAFYHYLLNLDLTDFNEFSRPVMTRAKKDLISLGLKPGQRFATEWLSGEVPLPIAACSTEQLYEAFRHWVDKNGERWAPNKANFTSQVLRTTEVLHQDDSGDPALVRKHVRLPYTDNGQKILKMFIPRGFGPIGEQKIGEWAAESIKAFDAALSDYKERGRANVH